MNAPKKRARKSSGTYRWAVIVFATAVCISAGLTLVSQSALENAGLVLACAISVFFILLGIVFDVIGMAATAADPKPLNSMASHKVPGAREALYLLRHASQVSSICNDVVGDICGIVSGVTAAVIVWHIQTAFQTQTVLISVAVTALISGLTIGGKALSKPFAIRQGTKVIWWVGRIAHFFHRR